MAIQIPHLIALLLLLAAIGLPILLVAQAAGKRKRAIASGQLVLIDRTNTLAIVALIAVFVGALPGIICGHIALHQIKQTSERGWGLAVASLWIGYVSLVAAIVIAIVATVVALSTR